jgi:hypothetical protein
LKLRKANPRKPYANDNEVVAANLNPNRQRPEWIDLSPVASDNCLFVACPIRRRWYKTNFSLLARNRNELEIAVNTAYSSREDIKAN